MKGCFTPILGPISVLQFPVPFWQPVHLLGMLLPSSSSRRWRSRGRRCTSRGVVVLYMAGLGQGSHKASHEQASTNGRNHPKRIRGSDSHCQATRNGVPLTAKRRPPPGDRWPWRGGLVRFLGCTSDVQPAREQPRAYSGYQRTTCFAAPTASPQGGQAFWPKGSGNTVLPQSLRPAQAWV